MLNMIEDIIASSGNLSKISSEAAEAYAQATDRLLNHVNTQLEEHRNIKELIGRNPLDLMHNNHKNHAMFMAAVFSLNSFELLARTIPWVYRAYHARGFSYDYFPAELVAWQIAIHDCLVSPSHKAEITAVYKWMVQQHDQFIKLSLSGAGLAFSVERETDALQEIFLSLLLHGDSQGCLKLANQSIQTVEELKHFYLDVVSPAMYHIGLLWENNQITVAEEHLATAIVGRVMASLYPRFAQFNVTRGRAVVSAGPNEFHEIGARMVADFLEMDGWDVAYLGANTPAPEILSILKQQQPFLLALSVATVFNLDTARQVIRFVKEDQETKDIKVMVGGLAFSGMPELWRELGADGHAVNADSALTSANDWWQVRSR
jgi:methanogenic corrinoid protein MtbC1